MSGDRYRVMVDDNFHYMDEDERYCDGSYDDYDTALVRCKAIVDSCLTSQYEPGMAADALFARYRDFGQDPFILPSPSDRQHFSAWTYARHRCEAICGPGLKAALE